MFITKKKKEFKVGTPGTVASTLKKHKELLDDAYVFSGGGVWTVSRVRRGECFKYTHPAIGKDCFSLAEVARHMASKMREQQREDKRNGRSLTPGRGSSSTCPSADATPPPAVEETELVPERWAEQMRATLGDDGRIVTFARNAATVDTAAPGNGVAENSSLEISVQARPCVFHHARSVALATQEGISHLFFFVRSFRRTRATAWARTATWSLSWARRG